MQTHTSMVFRPFAPPPADAPRISSREALQRILAEGRYALSPETVPVRDALGRISARDLRARHSIPLTLSAQVDGMAVRYADFPCDHALKEGEQCFFTGTGKALPEGFDTIVRVEGVEFDADGSVRILDGPEEKGEYTFPPGWEIRKDEVLVPRSLRLEPHHLGLLVAGGFTEIPVLRRPRVAVLPTGDELVPEGMTPGRGQTVNSNSVFLESYLVEMGAEPLPYPITGDDPALLRERVEDALSQADMVLVNGGSSRGRADFTVPVVGELGEVLVHGLNAAPGKPVLLAVADGKPIVGVPGPSLAAWYALEHIVAPMVNRFLDQPMELRKKVRGTLTRDLKVEGFLKDALLSLRVTLSWDGDRYQVTPFPLKNSMVTNFVDADGILRVPEGVDGYDRGEEVEVILLYGEEIIRQGRKRRIG